MSSTPARNRHSRSHLRRKLALALATIAVIGVVDIAPANAWYDAYGYWHPNYRYHSYYRHAAWRHHWWCDRHPYACGYHRPYYGYYDRY